MTNVPHVSCLCTQQPSRKKKSEGTPKGTLLWCGWHNLSNLGAYWKDRRCAKQFRMNLNWRWHTYFYSEPQMYNRYFEGHTCGSRCVIHMDDFCCVSVRGWVGGFTHDVIIQIAILLQYCFFSVLFESPATGSLLPNRQKAAHGEIWMAKR